MRTALLLPLAALACSPRTDGRNDCYTPCGSTVIGTLDTCEAVDAAEAAVLEAYAPVVPVAKTCAALSASTVTFAPNSEAGHFEDPKLGEVYGLAYEYGRRIVLADVRLEESAYPHEVGHLIDYTLGFPSHYEWKRRGWCAAQVFFWNGFGVASLPGRVCL